jgi:RimJ/RimL family protein N-acetyltransferase
MSEGRKAVLNIIGERVALGPHSRDLIPTYCRWMNDFAVARNIAAGVRPLTLDEEESWYDGAVRDTRQVLFTIYLRENLRPIGSAGLHDIHLANRTAEFGIIIGEKDCWGQGCGTETARLMLEYGFTALNLHSIYLTVHSHNQRGIRAYRRAGFQEVGRRREAIWLGGRAYDLIYMDCLAREFEGTALADLIPPVSQ